MTTRPRSRFHVPMVARIVVGIILGVVVGEVLGARAEPLAKVGTVILDMIKGLAGPLLLFAVLDAFLRTRVEPRSAGVMVAISLVNATIAIAIGLTLSKRTQTRPVVRPRRFDRVVGRDG